jgi:trehalose synthase-fused probable maltokinase
MPKFLLRQRWYPAKDLTDPPQVTVSMLVPLAVEGVAAAMAAWQVKASKRDAMEMFVPLALVPLADTDPAHIVTEVPTQLAEAHAGALIDGFSVDAFVRAWVKLHLGKAESVPSGTLRVGQTESLASAGLTDGGEWRIRYGKAEQSNTSIRIGERAILKVFRKLETGVHPELEVGRYLTQMGFTATPPLLAWIETDEGERASSTLSVLQRFVPNQGDGWSWTLERLGGAWNQEDQSALLHTMEWLRALARRTAEMHRAFAAGGETPAFRPEPVEAADLAEWASATATRAQRVFQELQAGGGHAGEPKSLRLASELQARRPLLERALRSLMEVPRTFAKTRHHGDFHLGQTLVVGNDAVIIDFEGEPLRPLDERRAKHCVLRDVAGMLRSLSYAVAAAERALPEDLPAQVREVAHVGLSKWHAQASTVFVDSYFEAAHDLSSLPVARRHAEQLLRFFLLEKALYEITYEMANRPDWIDIPLRGALDVLEQIAAAA